MFYAPKQYKGIKEENIVLKYISMLLITVLVRLYKKLSLGLMDETVSIKADTKVAKCM